MLCIYCGKDSNYKVRREGRKCGSCSKRFAFEPQEHPLKLTDPFFNRAIQGVSDEGMVFFTRRQLWYELNRRLRRRSRSFWGMLFRGFSTFSIFFLIGVPFVILIAVYHAIQDLRKRPPGQPILLSERGQSDGYMGNLVEIWEWAHGQIEKLVQANGQRSITPPSTKALIDLNTATESELIQLPIRSQTARNIIDHRSKGQVFEKLEDLLEIPGVRDSTLGALRPLVEFPSASAAEEEGSSQPPNEVLPSEERETEPDLTSYSFDSVLVTDHAEVAAMLVANNFHFENNCAVLSADGYPEGTADTVLTMLHRNPQLKVYALHDASPEGCMLPLTLREDRWFPDTSVDVIDLGLRPRHAVTRRVFTLIGTTQILPDSLRESLHPDEVAWLEGGQIAEVSVLRPARLIQGIYRGFAQGRELDTDAARAQEREEAYAYSGMHYYGGYYGSDSFG